MEGCIAETVRTFIVALLATAVGGSIAGIMSGRKVVKEQRRIAQEDKDLENLRLIRMALIELHRLSQAVATGEDDGNQAPATNLGNEIVLHTTLLSGNHMHFKGAVEDYWRPHGKADAVERVRLLAALIRKAERPLGYPPGTGHLEKNAE